MPSGIVTVASTQTAPLRADVSEGEIEEREATPRNGEAKRERRPRCREQG